MSGLAKHLAETGSCFTCVTNNEELRKSIKEVMPDFRLYAYIDHDPDTDEGKPHTHFIFTCNGTRKISHIADKLGISGQYIQVVRRITPMYRYLIHKDDPDKKQYKLTDIVTNHPDDFDAAVNGEVKASPTSLFNQYVKLSMGLMTSTEFIQANYREISKMNFYQKIQTFSTISKIVRAGTT